MKFVETSNNRRLSLTFLSNHNQSEIKFVKKIAIDKNPIGRQKY